MPTEGANIKSFPIIKFWSNKILMSALSGVFKLHYADCENHTKKSNLNDSQESNKSQFQHIFITKILLQERWLKTICTSDRML